MEKLIKYMKTHKAESIIGVIFIIMLIFVLIFAKIFFFSSGNNDYGERLDGIDKVKISGDKLDKIASTLKKDVNINKVESNITGKIINFMITVEGSVTAETMSAKADTILDDFSSKEKEFYDIQVFLVSSSDTSTFPAIGYKGKESTELLWIHS